MALVGWKRQPKQKNTIFLFFSGTSEPSVIDGHGLSVIDLGFHVRRASNIKISNGAWNEGAFTIYTDLMLAARAYGFADILRKHPLDSQAGTIVKTNNASNGLPAFSLFVLLKSRKLQRRFKVSLYSCFP